MFPEDQEISADFTIVLGMTLWRRPLTRAFELYRRGLSGRLIFSGGYNPKISGREACKMIGEAKAIGLDSDSIFCECDSSHTRENFENSLCIINNVILDTNIKLSVNIVAIAYHIRRAMMTARSVFPEGTRFGTASYPSIHYANALWHESERGRVDVSSELAKIDRYFPGNLPANVPSCLGGLAK